MEKITTNRVDEDGDTLINVTLTKTDDGFGFNIVGGVDKAHLPGDTGFFISRIRPGGAADKNKQLSVGDRLVSIDGVDLLGWTHSRAVDFFKSINSGQSSLLVIEKDGERNFLKKKLWPMPVSTPASVAETESVDEISRTPKQLFFILNPSHNSIWTEVLFVAVGSMALGAAVYFSYRLIKWR